MSSIEQAVVDYLNEQTIYPELFDKVYYHRVPTGIEMPWVIVTNSGGMRSKMTVAYTGIEDTLTIYVDSNQQFQGRTLAEKVLKLLENYRGRMGDVYDLYIRAGTIRDLDTFTNAYRYLLTFYVQYKEDRIENNHK
jgi:hypothetical protein